MPRLIHLNGPPGSGKSTLGRHYVAQSTGTLLVDPDTLLASIGGWQDNFWALIPVARRLAVALAGTHLRSGHDVVVSQLATSSDETGPWEEVGVRSGSAYVEIRLDCPWETVLERFRHGSRDTSDEVRSTVYRIVDATGGEPLLHKIYRDFVAFGSDRPSRSLTVTDRRPDVLAAALAELVGEAAGSE